MNIQIKNDNDITRIKIHTALTIYVAAEAKEQLMSALAQGQELEVDLSELEELDTAGVQLMLMLKQEAQRASKSCIFMHHSPSVREVIDLLNLAGVLGDPVVIPA